MLRTLLVVAAFLGTASANSKIAKPPSAKTRTAQLCLSDFAVAGMSCLVSIVFRGP